MSIKIKNSHMIRKKVNGYINKVFENGKKENCRWKFQSISFI